MPITYGDVKWPPAAEAAAQPFYDEWSAWYAGNPEQLAAFYGSVSSPTYPQPARRAARTGGLRGVIERFWWGRPLDTSGVTTKLHIPAAADVSALWADQLFGEPPTFVFPEGGDKLSDRFDTILLDGGVYAALPEAVELQSSRGGVYWRGFADVEIGDTSMIDSVLPERAVPTMRHGRLVAVTFWSQLPGSEATGTDIWRHLELHEVIQKQCYVFHALYQGTADQLGQRRPLGARDETKRFAAMADYQKMPGSIYTGSSILDCGYVPNMRPHRLLPGSDLGRSDYSGAEGPMDQLDESWSSLMRDVDQGRGRILLPREMLRSLGPGSGATFDSERSVFVELDMLQSAEDSAKQIEQIQFDIRVEEHLAVAGGLWRTIVRSAGLSASAFGEETGGGQQTATEANQREQRTGGNRDRKINYWTPELRRMARVLLEIDAHVFGGQAGAIEPPEVRFPPASALSLQVTAQSLQMLDAAKAISTPEKVRLLHPDWTNTRIDAEVAAIEGEAEAEVDQFSPPPTGDPTGAPQPVAPPGPGTQPAAG